MTPTEAVERCLSENLLLRPSARLLCAVSGGADSVALLLALRDIAAENGLLIEALHIQHGLRGQDSMDDQRFTEQLCESAGVPLRVRKAALTGTMDTPGAETAARAARLAIFREEAVSFDALLLAHHRDDQSETVLMHLLRGAGGEGLRGMSTASLIGETPVLRPFLFLSKADLTAWLAERKQNWRTDQSNFSPSTPRNLLRLNVLPEMEKAFPGAGKHIAEAAALLRRDEEFLTAEANRLFRKTVHTPNPLVVVNARRLKAAPAALSSRVLRAAVREAWARNGISPEERSLSMADSETLYALLSAGPGAVRNLPLGLRAEMGKCGCLFLELQNPLPPARARETAIHQGKLMLGGFRILVSDAEGSRLPSSPERLLLPPPGSSPSPILRLPHPDDRIHPLGASGSKPLRRFFTDRGIDRALRPYYPVLALENEILWIPGLCASEATRLSAAPPGGLSLTLTQTPFWIIKTKEC